MEISSNTTGMLAELCFCSDAEGREHCVVVVKGTFRTSFEGQLSLAEQQRPWVYADEHYGDPETTCVRYESDFAAFKPMAEVLVIGKAVAPHGKKAKEILVRLEVQGRSKDARVWGDRRWQRQLGMLYASDPVPFAEMPLTFDRAFGGIDDSKGAEKIQCEERNLHGVGFHPARPTDAAVGLPLPNIEAPGESLRSLRDRIAPLGFGVVSRSSKQRRAFSGTYDQKWLDEQCPFLPHDFDDRYHMSAPSDQWHPHFQGGERIRCVHMAQSPVVTYQLPSIQVPVRFRFRDATVDKLAVLDTVLVEPDLGEGILLWRTRTPLSKQREAFQVLVGPHERPREDDLVGYQNGKPHYRSLEGAARWAAKGRR